MKTQQKNSTGASALQITVAVALISASAVLVASGFIGTSATNPSAASDASSQPAPEQLSQNPQDSLSIRPRKETRTLSFADRVAYQHAIEEVYWRHRIWPKENTRPKPSLDAVMSQAQIEQKVHDYLRNSQLLADQWQRPITAEQLQAEMDRMAEHTKQPDVLRELFQALGNDPFAIAECLARPVLIERLPAHLAFERVKETSRTFSQIEAATASYALPTISDPTGGCTDDTWTATSLVNATAAATHTAVWTGSEMIVWGGFECSPNCSYLNTGGRYNPSTDSWTATSTTNTPEARSGHAAVWTGSEMIVWGGYGAGTYFHTGGRYNPSTDSWTPTSTTNWPIGRAYHTAVWTGSEMIVWGGQDANINLLNTGGRYNPGTNSWTATSITNAPSARDSHQTVWTGREMIVWGGGYITGGRYNPSADTWMDTSTTNAPTPRADNTAVWTGSEMIVWGGQGVLEGYLNTGGRYNPSTDSWTATSTTNAPDPRSLHTAVWTGREMIVWGGRNCSPNCMNFNTGGRYNPGTDGWVATSTTNAPTRREDHTAVWTGSEMIALGGFYRDDHGFHFLNSGGRYCAQPSTPIVQSAVSRKAHGSAGSFDIVLPLNGTAGVECRTGGATNDYMLVVTFSANVSVNGNPQAAVTSGIGTIGSGGVSNGGMVILANNVVTIPLTNVTNAQTINVTLFDVNGVTNLVIPMSLLTGDVNGNRAVDASDVSLTKSRIGQSVNFTNFRPDVSAGGSINATDVAIVKSHIGTGLP